MTAATGIDIRVTVGDTWQPLQLTAVAGDTVAAVKSLALRDQSIDERAHGAYEVKAGGALIRDESKTLAECGIRNGSALVILARRRRPVR